MQNLELKNNPQKVAFIGCGNMAQAIIGGMVDAGWPADNIMASNPSSEKLERVKSRYGIRTTNDNTSAAKFASTVIFCVKPQKLAATLSQLAKVDFSEKLAVSVAAGFQSQQMTQQLQQDIPIVRAMPNTPSLIKQGATGLWPNSKVNANHKELVELIFNAIGQFAWVEKESQINMVTAIAGSSPAYVFLMMQAMVEQAQVSGISEKDAVLLVTQAFSGAAQLAQQTPNKSLDQLRREVTSPGGTTAAAITNLMNAGFESMVKNAVLAAEHRGKELGKQST